MALTPMMQQYMDIKEQNKDSILFFRLGDFYEMFFEDAKLASRELEITLTGKDCGLNERAPMCGIPFHSADSYISKLIKKGYKVAICEQLEDASQCKGLVKRDIVRIVTPGTLTDSNILEEKRNNYLLSIYKKEESLGIALADVSTGELLCSFIDSGNLSAKLFDEIAKFHPTEIIVGTELANHCGTETKVLIDDIKKRFEIFVSIIEDKYFETEFADSIINEKFKGQNDLSEINGLSKNAIGALLYYLDKTQKTNLDHIVDIKTYKISEFMSLDLSTRRNLELTETIREKSKKGSLLWVLDKTVTSMGGRLLRKWLEEPLLNVHDINDRLDAVSEFKDKFMVRMETRELLKRVYDIERLMGKVIIGNVNSRDLISLKNSIEQMPYIKNTVQNCESGLNKKIYSEIDELKDIYTLINESICDEPPITITEGGIIKSGFNEKVDELRLATTDGKNWIAALEASERRKTGIKNIKIGFNKVFGYFIEVTKSYFSLVPDYYVRKQTLANCERFITDDLKKIEETILGAESKVIDLEYQIFLNIKEKIAIAINRVKLTAKNVACLDVLCALADLADRECYLRPEISDNGKIKIVEGRHPVVEKITGMNAFVPNDTFLDTTKNRLSIITGPNMAGKSTYMRQVALIVLMAQIGSFVPAKEAMISIVDKIFTRVGASDDLASGQSTFMVEMSEVANILNNATSKSLLILDEIGRGTSTFDGLSIAWSVIEYISNTSKMGSRTLFATHYHELTELEGKLTGIKNYCISVQKQGDDIIFLRKIIRGGADDSYGIQVAKLAGIPQAVIDRAKEILKELEDADVTKYERKLKKNRRQIEGQIDIFSMPGFTNLYEKQDTNKIYESKLVNELNSINITTTTPIDALNILNKLKNMTFTR